MRRPRTFVGNASEEALMDRLDAFLDSYFAQAYSPHAIPSDDSPALKGNLPEVPKTNRHAMATASERSWQDEAFLRLVG